MEDDPLAGHPVLRTIRVLGRSGSNVVVLASNTATGQLVAVKLIPRGFDSRQAKYLLRELLNHYELSLAKHPHIVSLLDCFLTPRHIAIVLEYVDGENLQVFLEKAGGCIIEPLARFLFQQLVIALDFCHRKGKINRNIKPSSLLLQLSDSSLPLLRMVDFSVCKDTLRHSEPRSQVGTAMYCAPEVLQDFRGMAYDGLAADMWSVGVVLFMMLFGRHPFSRPEDTSLPAQQQVIAMFKRVTAPPGSYDGDLYVPHVLPTSVLPGAQLGAPLSLPAADILRGLLARDPKARTTLHGVQQHEWFGTGLPEGAALLNEVVAAEEAAAGAAAVMPPAVAAQMERMVLAAAAGPAMPLGGAPPPLFEGRRSSSGGAGGGGNGPAQGYGGPGTSGGGAAAAGPGSVPHAPQTPPPSHQEQPQHQQAPPQHPTPQDAAVVRTVTTTAASQSDAVQSASIGSAVAGPAPTLLGGGGAPAVPPAAMVGLGPSLVSPVWSLAGSVAGGGGGGGDGPADPADDLLANLEAMVMGVPEDDFLAAASLDFIVCASQHQQQQQQEREREQLRSQQHQSQQPPKQQRPQLSCTSTPVCGGGNSAPVSTDTAGTHTVPSPPQPQPHPPQSLSPPLAMQYSPQHLRHDANFHHHHHQPHQQQDYLARGTEPGDGGSTAVSAPPRESDFGAPPPAVPQTLAELLGRAGGNGPAVADCQTAGPSPPAPQLFTSLHSAAAAAVAHGLTPLDVTTSLLMRLNTEALPSPTTLAVVDAQPFLAQQPSVGCAGGFFPGLGLGDPSMATIPSTYSMDWCSLSARSETLLSPKLLGSSGGSGGGGSGPSGSAAATLAQSSLWHKICNGCSETRGALAGMAAEARERGRAAISGLARR